MTRQRDILNEVADLVNAGKVRSTACNQMGAITVENLRKAHTLLESGKAKGKLTLRGFGK